jgi:Ni/Co efflux regulator RcnB
VAARYHWPRGQFYHRYRAGMRMQSFFWLTDYVIVDYDDYELAAPSAACEWVRYGPDLLLINLSTGEVVDVVYGAFVEAPPVDPHPADGAGAPDLPHS